ncbi:MAG: hypothetical protein ACSLFB_10780 [Acidimicrobiales bacterium]
MEQRQFDQQDLILRKGYLPAVVILAVLALLVTLTPSKGASDRVLGLSVDRNGTEGTFQSEPGAPSAPGGASPLVTTGGTGTVRPGGSSTPTRNAPPEPTSTGSGGESAAPASGGGAVTTAGNCEGGARQTREPYSPPCITFSGDNGGATSPGVTGDTITVAFREGNLPSLYAVAGQVAEKANIKDNEDDVRRTMVAYFDYFNKKFQLYGRQVKPVFYKGQGDQLAEFFGSGVETANADAVKVGQEIKGFADLSVLSTPYAEALVRQKVIAIPPIHMSRQWYEKQAPYAYGVFVDCSRLLESVIDYGLKRLIGFKARYAGDPSYRSLDRTLGLIVPEEPWYQECANEGDRLLRVAGKKLTHRINYKLDFTRLSSDAVGMVAQMKDKGVTTLICGCDPILPLFLTTQATQQNYRPEWGVIGTALTDVDLLGQIYDQEQWRHAAGISFLDDIYQGTKTEAYRTYREIRNDEPAFIASVLYYPILMFFLGVHMAGPNLTPSTFEQGLFNYPEAVGETGTWNFGPGDRTATDDAREMYYDPKIVSPFNGEPGKYVKTLDGKRFTNNWPAGEAVFPVEP